jgi:mutator protein MutT
MGKVAVILLRNASGEILLQHRTANDPTYPDHWAFFGGHIEDGETPEQAVTREAMEELQYELARPTLFKVHTSVPDCVIYVFVEGYSGAKLVWRRTGHVLVCALRDQASADERSRQVNP